MKLVFLLAVTIFFTSCSGEVDQSKLPDELKGLKLYEIDAGFLNTVQVAVLNNQVNSTTYSVGKSQQSTIIVNQNTGKAITVSQILFENDSMVVARK